MKKEIIAGIFGSLGLLLFYFGVMGISSGSWSATTSQFKELWYWMLPLSIGFGIQIGLYTHIKDQISKIKNTYQKSPLRQGYEGQAKSITVTSGTISSISMIACCAHHLSEMLPIIGLF